MGQGTVHPPDLPEVHALGTLVGHGSVDIPVAHHDHSLLHLWQDLLPEMFLPVRSKEERMGMGVHGEIPFQHLPQESSHRKGRGFEGEMGPDPLHFQGFNHLLAHRGLA